MEQRWPFAANGVLSHFTTAPTAISDSLQLFYNIQRKAFPDYELNSSGYFFLKEMIRELSLTSPRL